MRAVAERIRSLLALHEIFRQNDFARQVWVVGINTCVHDGDDDGRVAQRCVPGLPRSNELRRPLRNVPVMGRGIGVGVIRIVRDEHGLHDVIQGHRFDVGILLEPGQQRSQGCGA